MTVLPHHSYSSNLACVGLELFPKIKIKLRSRDFENSSRIVGGSTKPSHKQTSRKYSNSKKIAETSIRVKWDYIEGEGGHKPVN